MVIDLSVGPSATNYPVSTLSAVPAGGWADEYKTTKMVFSRIPAGTFTMGSPTNESGRYIDEIEHQVILTHTLYVGVFEITQKQWERVMGTWPSGFTNAAYRNARPVELVSYAAIRGSIDGTNWPASSSVDADSFMGRLRARTGLAFDLPTESQWEYAGRAGTTTSLNSGFNLTNEIVDSSDSHLDAVGRYFYNGGSGYTPNGDTSVGTAKVGSYLPNAWGLHDMHGNVWEWCLDRFGAYPGTVSDPKGAGSGETFSIRGGGFFHPPSSCRVAARNDSFPSSVSLDHGFRAVFAQADADFVVVDLTDGPSATNYPVNTHSFMPAGGWSDEYKTTKLVLRHIPAGTFMMGSPTNEYGRELDEIPHGVSLTQDFYIGVFEVTQRQWERVMGTWPSYFTNATYRESRPVEQVSYNTIRGSGVGAGWPATGNVDSNSFMGRLRARTGLAFDLPTESQWEYAGRAGTSTALNSGHNLTFQLQDLRMSEVGRYWLNGGFRQTPDGDPAVGTATVGSYLPNAWGLYDIHGNVWERCLDWYGVYPGTVSDPKGAVTGTGRVKRAGSWSTGFATACRVARRSGLDLPDVAPNYVGFRAALPLEP